MKRLVLGKKTKYPSKYDPTLLCAVKRKHIAAQFYGFDLWRAYELSWLDTKGKPHVGILELIYPCDTRCIVESKSLKLYLGSFNYANFGSKKEVEDTIRYDIEQVLSPGWIKVKILEQKDLAWQSEIQGICLDDMDIDASNYIVAPELLRLEIGHEDQTVYSHLLRSTCPITGQPDWATVIITYKGQKIDHASLLRYIISYREHKGFSEACCEQIFADICKKCKPDYLMVYCLYTRRGGIDINPVRCSEKISPEETDKLRLPRQ
jgi:7-cyano-7-deazaguanine reductase